MKVDNIVNRFVYCCRENWEEKTLKTTISSVITRRVDEGVGQPDT